MDVTCIETRRKHHVCTWTHVWQSSLLSCKQLNLCATLSGAGPTAELSDLEQRDAMRGMVAGRHVTSNGACQCSHVDLFAGVESAAQQQVPSS